MSKKGVIFDWGGVLMRTEDYAPRHRWDEKLGLPAGAVERVVHGLPEWEQVQRGRVSLDAYWSAVQQALGLTPADTLALAESFYSGDRLDEELVAFIRELRSRGVPVGLLSNNGPALAAEIEALGLGGLFTTQVISATIGVMKPDARAYHAALDALGIRPEEALFIDDSPANVEGARRVGMRALHFQPGVPVQEITRGWLNGVGDDG